MITYQCATALCPTPSPVYLFGGQTIRPPIDHLERCFIINTLCLVPERNWDDTQEFEIRQGHTIFICPKATDQPCFFFFFLLSHANMINFMTHFLLRSSNQPVLHRRGTQEHKVSFDDIISLSQSLLSLLQGQLGVCQMPTRLLVLGLRQPLVCHAQRSQALLFPWQQMNEPISRSGTLVDAMPSESFKMYIQEWIYTTALFSQTLVKKKKAYSWSWFFIGHSLRSHF